ncbi:hypothetical protein H5410_050075 [Solanum commersonii]|uniref:Uncharacterized protein n=1 Tax=Solanum commersonii TaxID=4109 RepID=A0A9J5WWT7_SOLCO|nr:hypothetical protein H5410_050075 [Solanum commersonii]
MQHVEQSKDDKSHKLFKIRDELASLSEQARMIQYEINQLSTEQEENTSEVLLSCEHLDTCPKRNSNPKKNITPNKVARYVPLAPSAKNFSKVGKQHPKEEEYLAFTRYIYNLPEESGETYGVLGTTNLFPRISIYPNGSPSFTAQLFKFGYLDRVYAKTNLQELSKLPLQLITDKFNFKVLDHDHDWVLMTKGKSKSKTLKENILGIELHIMEASEETWKLACKFLDHKHSINEDKVE